MKATIRHYLELAAQWLIGWLMDQFLADPIAHLEEALKQLAEVKGGGVQPENPSLTLPAFAEDGGGEGIVGGARGVGGGVTHQAAANAAAANAAGQRLALGIAFVLASIVFLAGFVVGRVL